MSGIALTQPVAIGLGLQEPFAVQAPAAGQNFSFVADGHGYRRLVSLVLTLTASAVNVNRYLKLQWQGGDGNPYAVAAVAATVGAASVQRYVFSSSYSAQAWNTGTDGFAPLPAVYLAPGDVLASVVDNLDVGDTLTLIRGVMERFPLDGAGLPPRPAVAAG